MRYRIVPIYSKFKPYYRIQVSSASGLWLDCFLRDCVSREDARNLIDSLIAEQQKEKDFYLTERTEEYP